MDSPHALPFFFFDRYHSLVTKYGKLEPLAEIDLKPRCHAQVEVHCEEKVEQVSFLFMPKLLQAFGCYCIGLLSFVSSPAALTFTFKWL